MENKQNYMEKYREKLEYSKIIARLAEYASFAPGRELLEALTPLPSLSQAKEAMAATTGQLASPGVRRSFGCGAVDCGGGSLPGFSLE